MAKSDKPNILIIWGDDIGIWNISHFSRGMMGYHTPNIDRIAEEGATFTDFYGQQSCTADRSPVAALSPHVRTPPCPIGPGSVRLVRVAGESMADFQKKEGWIFAQVSVASWKEQVDQKYLRKFCPTYESRLKLVDRRS